MFSINFKRHFFLIHYVLLFYQYNFVTALIGPNVRPAEENEFPALVSIMKVNNGTRSIEKYHKCSGTLISRQDVLTAEHCLRNTFSEGFKIMIGSHNLFLSVPYFPLFIWTYEHWTIYRQSRLYASKPDIAIIKIIGNIPNTMQFAPLGNIDHEMLYGLDAITAGWGKFENNTKPRILHAAELKMLSKSECEDRYYMLEENRAFLDDKRICTVGDPYTVLNKGDSGGPLLFCGVLVAVNIAVAPPGPANPNQINIHLGIRHFTDYIQDVLRSFHMKF